MQYKKKPKIVDFLLIALCVLALAFIRFFEETLFYDPFLKYFKSDYLNLPFPDFNGIGLFFSLLFRYVLNASLSIAVIYFLFKDVSLTKFASILYLLLFILLILMFFGVVLFFDEKSNFILFYVRRFIVQPLFLVLFVPAFYFQKKHS
ncbi:exosortase F system-associated protein [Flavobacterium azooxidireducens]|uniref:Exosortase F system-associated protein n=1 Tax=Flavobacterium azooxidireducens TaxID=1871076 RepID=A0ABY4KGG3_9FLAO|nr:exosortase F system-associated protein [Flavobacterium azooxidireducens]UPQ79895.1 exosortase F system-associated protein [Flavobacterium azooxidireducens]